LAIEVRNHLFHCSFINVGYIVLIDVLIYSAAACTNV